MGWPRGKDLRCPVSNRPSTISFQHLILAEAASESQKKGKPGQLVDPRPEAVEGGEIKIKITPQLVHDIFDEYPIVAKAYSENVPENVRLACPIMCACTDSLFSFSYQRRSSGKDISNRNCFTHIVLPFVRRQLSMW